MSSVYDIEEEGRAEYAEWLDERAEGLAVVMWQWRDGSIHAEMRMVTMGGEEADTHSVKVMTHLTAATDRRFKTACDRSYWGVTSSSGLGDPARVDCPACRAILYGREAKLGGR